MPAISPCRAACGSPHRPVTAAVWGLGSFGRAGDIPGASAGVSHIGWIEGDRAVHYDWSMAVRFPATQAQQPLAPHHKITHRGTTGAATPDGRTYCERAPLRFVLEPTKTWLWRELTSATRAPTPCRRWRSPWAEGVTYCDTVVERWRSMASGASRARVRRCQMQRHRARGWPGRFGRLLTLNRFSVSRLTDHSHGKLCPAHMFGQQRALVTYALLDAALALSETLGWMTWRVDARSTVPGPSGRPASSDLTMRPLTPVGISASTS
jgi:hypothetical protein